MNVGVNYNLHILYLVRWIRYSTFINSLFYLYENFNETFENQYNFSNTSEIKKLRMNSYVQDINEIEKIIIQFRDVKVSNI